MKQLASMMVSIDVQFISFSFFGFIVIYLLMHNTVIVESFIGKLWCVLLL